MRLKPQQPAKAFAVIEALKGPGQKAYLVGYGDYEAIRITNPYAGWNTPSNEITRPSQLKVKEYKIIA